MPSPPSAITWKPLYPGSRIGEPVVGGAFGAHARNSASESSPSGPVTHHTRRQPAARLPGSYRRVTGTAVSAGPGDIYREPGEVEIFRRLTVPGQVPNCGDPAPEEGL
ncbi:hypothetical protein GCM10029964_084190 [Kibdelosporangium lantanae]